MKNIQFFILLFTIGFTSCNNVSTEYEIIRLNPKDEKVKMSQFIEQVEYVKLKTLGYPTDDINGAIFGKTVDRDGDNKLITTIEPMQIMNDEKLFPKQLDYLNLSQNSNPIVAIYNLK